MPAGDHPMARGLRRCWSTALSTNAAAGQTGAGGSCPIVTGSPHRWGPFPAWSSASAPRTGPWQPWDHSSGRRLCCRMTGTHPGPVGGGGTSRRPRPRPLRGSFTTAPIAKVAHRTAGDAGGSDGGRDVQPVRRACLHHPADGCCPRASRDNVSRAWVSQKVRAAPRAPSRTGSPLRAACPEARGRYPLATTRNQWSTVSRIASACRDRAPTSSGTIGM
jgi:hypothetical protein